MERKPPTDREASPEEMIMAHKILAQMGEEQYNNFDIVEDPRVQIIIKHFRESGLTEFDFFRELSQGDMERQIAEEFRKQTPGGNA